MNYELEKKNFPSPLPLHPPVPVRAGATRYTLHARRGFGLVEVVIYAALVGIIFTVVVQTLTGVTRSYASFKVSKDIEVSASSALGQMSREIRNADSVVVASSTLSSNPGKLTLAGSDPAGVARTVEFSLSGGVLHSKENAIDTGALTAGSVTVTNLIFRLITTSVSKAVKVEMTLQSGTGGAKRTRKFYETEVLRNSY